MKLFHFFIIPVLLLSCVFNRYRSDDGQGRKHVGANAAVWCRPRPHYTLEWVERHWQQQGLHHLLRFAHRQRMPLFLANLCGMVVFWNFRWFFIKLTKYCFRLQAERHNHAYQPQPPFHHNELVELGKLKVKASVKGWYFFIEVKKFLDTFLQK